MLTFTELELVWSDLVGTRTVWLSQRITIPIINFTFWTEPTFGLLKVIEVGSGWEVVHPAMKNPVVVPFLRNDVGSRNDGILLYDAVGITRHEARTTLMQELIEISVFYGLQDPKAYFVTTTHSHSIMPYHDFNFVFGPEDPAKNPEKEMVGTAQIRIDGKIRFTVIEPSLYYQYHERWMSVRKYLTWRYW